MSASDSPSSSVPSVSQAQPTQLQQQIRVLTGVLAHYSALPHSEDSGVMTTLDMTLNENVIMVQNVLAKDDGSVWDELAADDFRIAHLIFHYVVKVDKKTGEDISSPMMTMVGPDGVYHTGSQYAYRDLQRIAQYRGLPPWNPPIRVRPARSRSRNGKDYQSLLLVE